MQMENEDVKAIILLQIENVFMHRLVRNQKTLFTSGSCKVAKLQNNNKQPVYFLNLNSFYYGIQPDLNFVKIVYSDTVAYVFPHFENGLSAISLKINSFQIQTLDQILRNAARLIDCQTAMQNPRIKQSIEAHYRDISTEQIYNPDNIKYAITSGGKILGNVFTTIGGYIKGGVQKVGSYLNEKVSQGQPAQIKPQTKARWQSLKEGTSNAFKVSAQYANKILNPVLNKTNEYVHGINQKIDNSQNAQIKYAKELVQVSGKAIGQAFDGFVKSGTQIAKEVGNQGKKLIMKKYGDQVVTTLVGENKEEVQKQQNKEVHIKKQENSTNKQKEEGNTNVRLNQTSKDQLYPDI